MINCVLCCTFLLIRRHNLSSGYTNFHWVIFAVGGRRGLSYVHRKKIVYFDLGHNEFNLSTNQILLCLHMNIDTRCNRKLGYTYIFLDTITKPRTKQQRIFNFNRETSLPYHIIMFYEIPCFFRDIMFQVLRHKSYVLL